MRVRVLPLIFLCPLLTAAQPEIQTSLALDRFVVTAKRPTGADAATQDAISTYDSAEIEESGAFSVQEFLGNLPRGNGGQQLVLIDGVPTYLDISTLSPAMIAAIEVSYSGSMPAYGAYSKGGPVINIRLKQNYTGRELSLEAGASAHADAWRREAMVSGGLFRGPWRMFYSVRYSSQDALMADERSFSREQDRRAQGGKDYRLPWGSPAVVQAVSGNLPGLLDASGNPVSVALVLEASGGSLLPGDFLAASGPAASGQRTFNTSPYLYLSSPSESLAGSFRVTRALGPKLTLNAGTSYRVSRSDRFGPPPVSAAATDTLVPAAFNPFGRDVLVGLVHTGFGPVRQESESDNVRFNLSASWMGQTWRSNLMLSHVRSSSSRDNRDLDPAAFSAALAATDPAKRFNPFVGAAGSAANTALYETLAIHRTEDSANHSSQLNLRAYGPVSEGWGAGPVQVTLGANAGWRENERSFRNLRGVADDDTLNRDSDYSVDGSVELPLAKERPRLYRMEGRLSGAYSANDAGGSSRRQGVSLMWAPVRAWLFRAGYGENRSTPGEQNDDDVQSALETLIDPRRTPAAAENVQVVSRRTVSTRASRGEDLEFTVSFEPAGREGLRFSLNYNRDRRTQATGSPFNAQDVIDNEGLFTGRVVRDAATAADLALGQPGRILAVDTTAAAVAGQERSELDFDVEFRTKERPAGRFQFNVGVEHLLTARYEVADGQQFVSREEGPANLPDWNGRVRVQWNRQQWNASAQVRYTGASGQGTIPAYASVNLNAGYRFAKPVWGKFGKDLSLRAGVQHLGGNRPPYADTLLGYRGGSALGTMFSLSARLPL